MLTLQGRHALAMVRELQRHPPPLARIRSVSLRTTYRPRLEGLRIVASKTAGQPNTEVLPDIATCSLCRADIASPRNRRFRYAFTNCTHCGPRYSIIEDLPYDRQRTSMRRFEMCPDCQREYDDPADRRFHAQPNACPVCGPQPTLLAKNGTTIAAGNEAITLAAKAIASGKIVAIKSIGGYQLACDATNRSALLRLRRRKQRPRKPFALMCANLAKARSICSVSRAAAQLLSSPQAPIVLMPRRGPIPPGDLIAPQNSRLGVMLAYTPLHIILFSELRKITGTEPLLVMTSANPKDEPISHDEASLFRSHAAVFDFALTHDRPILNRADDSVVLPTPASPIIVRRARGYAPAPIELNPMLHVKHPVLAVGPEWKNTFCLAVGDKAWLSPHIGSVVTASGEEFFLSTLDRYQAWTGIRPAVVACDLHPDYAATRLAERLAAEWHVPLLRVQHHLAHILSVLAETSASAPLLGIAADGTGYGTDGTCWGCEFLLIGRNGTWRRVGTMLPLALPGAGAELADPRQVGSAYLAHAKTTATRPRPASQALLCSSLGRLFDAAAGISRICLRATYDAEAAIAVESAAEPLPVERHNETGSLILDTEPALIDPRPIISAVSRETAARGNRAAVAALFQDRIAEAICQLALHLGRKYRLSTVAISGGSFQNCRLLATLTSRLTAEKLYVITNRLVPPNDGGVALGQAAAAAWSRSTLTTRSLP